MGEDLIAEYFEIRGFKLLARNFRRRGCELDLVLCRGSDLLVIEVKTRKSQVDDIRSVAPPRKLKALSRGLHLFLHEHPETTSMTIHLGLAVISGYGTQRQNVFWQRLPIREDIET